MSYRYVFLGRYCCFVAVVIAFPLDDDFLWNYFCWIIVNCMGVEIKKSSSCILCNRKLNDSNTKLECQLLLQVDNKFLTYTAFNDSIQSFLKNIGCATPAAELNEKELTIKHLSAGTQKNMADKAARMISH